MSLHNPTLKEFSHPDSHIQFLTLIDPSLKALNAKRSFYESIGCKVSAVSLCSNGAFKLCVQAKGSNLERQAF